MKNENLESRCPVWILFLVCMFTSACNEDTLVPLEIPPGCNPLAFSYDCLLPFPSDFFLVEDPTLPSGKRVRLSEKSVVYSNDGKVADPTSVHPADGFSTTGPILAVFPRGFDSDNLVFHNEDVFRSLTKESPTLILEANSLEPVLHFAEADALVESDERRVLIIRPLVRLKNSTRYIVAIHSLLDKSLTPLQPPEGFLHLRDGLARGNEVLESLARRYETEIFPRLESFGIPRHTLQLAWDFTTSSEENQTRDMLRIRQLLIEHFKQNKPQVKITKITDNYGEKIFRRVEGIFQVPLFLDSTEPGAKLFRDELGRVSSNGVVDVPFSMLIPRSVSERQPDDPPARLVQYGHGFFGGRDWDFDEKGLIETLDRGQMVLVATDWWGMSRADVAPVIEAIANRPSEVAVFTDRVHQAMANFLALAYAAVGPMAEVPEIQVDDRPLYDNSTLYFYGNSQGHILGGTYVALSPHLERAVLGVGGAAFSMMMSRARAFLPFLELIKIYINDPIDIQKYLLLIQITLDRIDPLTYAPKLLENTLPDSPPLRKVLMQMGLEDTEVPNLGTYMHARAAGLHQLPATVTVPGLTQADYPLDGSGLVIFDFGVPPLPAEARAPTEENIVHTGVRKLPAAIEQILRFLRPGGLIEATCEGLCDPE